MRETERTSRHRKLVYDAALQAAPKFKFPVGTEKTGFCLITLMNGACCGAQQCHIIPLELAKNDEMPSWHWAFDRGHWALAPLDIGILERLLEEDFTKENPLQDIYDDPNTPKQFRYAFVAFPPIEGRYIGRCNEANLLQPPTKANPVTLHYYPFSTLPIITSHVRPHYVIYDLGKKLAKHAFGKDEFEHMLGRENGSTISFACLRIYRQWMDTKLPETFKGPLRTAKEGPENGIGEATGGDGTEISGVDRESARSSGKYGLRRNPVPSEKFQSTSQTGRAGSNAVREVPGGVDGRNQGSNKGSENREGGSKRRGPSKSDAVAKPER
ncbi:hypothetical protein H0H92_006112 [Tricholoma furcatifolium]|nr:hypothetical protein H0H92_006112 [Tricholoma furcatifolium]